MPFFDIMDDVARHQIDKTDMGDNRLMGVLVCQVVKNYDKDHQGLVLVNITTRDYQENKLVWARMAFPYGGQKWGEYFIPEVGDQVLVVFEQGNIDGYTLLMGTTINHASESPVPDGHGLHPSGSGLTIPKDIRSGCPTGGKRH